MVSAISEVLAIGVRVVFGRLKEFEVFQSSGIWLTILDPGWS